MLPDQNISVGHSWGKEPLRKSQVEYVTNICKLDRIDQNVAYIKTSSDVKQLNQSLLLNGKEDGDIEIEVNTGMVINCTKKQN